MNSKSKIGLLVFVVLLLAILLWFLRGDRGYDWNSEFRRAEESQPYGLKFFQKYLKQQFQEDDFHYCDSSISITLPKYDEENITYNYLFIGYQYHLLNEELEATLQFVEQGNNMFFMVRYLPEKLLERLNKNEPCSYYINTSRGHYDTLVQANFVAESLRLDQEVDYVKMDQDKAIKDEWYFIDDSPFCEDNKSFEKLGMFNRTKTNFFRVKYGKGYFYFHTNPIFFTNYYLTKPANQRYVELAMSYADGQELIWDRNTRLEDFEKPKRGDKTQRGSPFQFVLNNESLRWGLYTLLGVLLSYLLINLKRKERSIPIIPFKENSSIEYVETISELFFQRKGNDKIYEYINNQFFDFIRKRYHLSTKEVNDDFIQKLSIKSKVKKDRVKMLFFIQKEGKNRSNIDEDYLIRYHKLIQYFYNNCK